MNRLQSLVSTSITISIITLGTRGLGLLRDSLLASQVGTGSSADHFFLFISCTHFLISIVATSGINITIPKLKNRIQDSTHKIETATELKSFYWGIFLVSLSLSIFLPFSSKFSLVFGLLGGLIVLTQGACHMQSGVLNLKGIFFKPAMTWSLPVLFTLIPILTQKTNSFDLIVFYFLGSLLQFFLLFNFRALKELLRSFKNHRLLQLLPQWSFVALATLYFPTAEVLNIFFASFLEEGAVATMSYAMKIPLAITNILIFSIWTVLLPNLSSNLSNYFNQKNLKLLVVAGIASLGGAFILYLGSPFLVQWVYGRGDGLSSSELNMITSLQKIYCLCIPLQILGNLSLRCLHATGKTRLSILVSLIGIITFIIIFATLKKTLFNISLAFAANYLICVLTLTALFLKNIKTGTSLAQ